MFKYIGFLYFILQQFPAIGQEAVSIVYEQEQFGSFRINHELVPYKNKLRLLYNDSMAYHYYFLNNRDVLKKQKLFGVKFLHHSSYYKKQTGMIEYAVSKKVADDDYLVYDTANKIKWVMIESPKVIKGYHCEAALHVNERNDSLLVYYAPELAQPYGPATYNGLPGVILEVFDQRFGLHILAKKIEMGFFPIAYPEHFISISQQAFILKKVNIYDKRR